MPSDNGNILMRKGTRNLGAGQNQSCGGSEMVTGGRADPLGQSDGDQCGSAEMVSGGVENPVHQNDGKQGDDQQAGPPPTPCDLQHAAKTIISALHATKQELAKEMEANLKQLKAVLKESQRIAKDMEAAIQEAKSEPSLKELSRGNGHAQGQERHQEHQGRSAGGDQGNQNQRQAGGQNRGQNGGQNAGQNGGQNGGQNQNQNGNQGRNQQNGGGWSPPGNGQSQAQPDQWCPPSFSDATQQGQVPSWNPPGQQ